MSDSTTGRGGESDSGRSDPNADVSTLPSLPTVECPHCAVVVPEGHFCGSCGADLTRRNHGPAAARRLHAYAAFPDEPIYRLSVVSSLFPHLSHHSRAVFRVATGCLVVFLFVLAIGGLEPPLIAVAAVGFPLLFQIYVIEVGPYDDHVLLPSFVTLVVGAALGVGWAQIGGPYVQRDLVPTLQWSLASHPAFSAAVLVPLTGQLLMCVPLAVLFFWRRSKEALDGFVIGASGALWFTAAATIANLSSRLPGGILADQPFVDVISQALIRGLSVPLVAAFGTGLFGAALWMRRRSHAAPTAAGGVWLTSPIGALALVLLLHIGLGYTDVARIPLPALVVVHLGAVVVLIAFRVWDCTTRFCTSTTISRSDLRGPAPVAAMSSL